MRNLQSPLRNLVFFAFCIAFAAIAHAQQPDPTQPPAREHPILTLHATGSQIYSCQQTGHEFQWVFLAPAARLFNDAGNEVATHGDGPVWNYQDGSSIQGVVLAQSPSPDPAAIPWLLLKAQNPQRDAAHQGDFTRSPYTATYTFYSATH